MKSKKQKKEKINFKLLAETFMFSKRRTSDIIREFGLQYRKHKTVVDLLKARRKSLKNGMYKTEYELNMLEVYLKDIFKLTRKED